MSEKHPERASDLAPVLVWDAWSMPIMRHDGTTDWGLLVRRVFATICMVMIVSVLYLAGARLVVMNTDLCPPPWHRMQDADACFSPM